MGNQALKDKILEVLGSEGGLSVSQLAEKLICANQKVMEAVDELDDQGLLDSSINGSAVVYSLVSQADAKRPEKEVFKPSQPKPTVEARADGKLATVKLMVIEALNDVPNQTMTRAQLLTTFKTVPAAVLDNCLQKMKADKSLHSVGRGVFKLGSMPVSDAADAIEKVVNQAFEAKPENKALTEEKPETVIAVPVAEQLTASNKNTDVGNAQDCEQILPAMTLMHGLVIDRLACFDDGTTTVILNDGQELIFNPVDAKRIYRHMYRFFN